MHRLPVEKITIVRRLAQTAFFVVSGQWLLTGFLRCPFGVPFINCTSCPLGDCTGRVLQIPFLVLLILSGVVIGRVFCGWICPLGYLQDLLGKIPHPHIERTAWFQRIEPFLRAIKYVFLVLVVFAIVLFNFPAERPYPYVVRTPTLFNAESLWLAVRLGAVRYPVRIGLFVFALVTALFVFRFWCRYVCPFGAFFALFNKISLLRITRTSACRRCGRYPRECLQHTVPGTPDCIICGDCVEGCPHNAIVVRRALRGDDGTEASVTGERVPAAGDSNG